MFGVPLVKGHFPNSVLPQDRRKRKAHLCYFLNKYELAFTKAVCVQVGDTLGGFKFQVQKVQRDAA